MTTSRNPTRQRLVNAALTLFARQGITETTTKQIAELAEVNEVTLFRQFGNKQGLVLAILEESALFDRLAAALAHPPDPGHSPAQTLQHYAQSYLGLFDTVPEMLRSLVGEGGKSPIANRQALGRGLDRANQALAAYLRPVGETVGGDRWVSLINSTLLGYAVLELTTEFHGLWSDRDRFVEDLVNLVLAQAAHASVLAPAVATPVVTTPAVATPAVLTGSQLTVYAPPIADLPAPLVHQIFQQAQKKGTQELALVYLLFGAGVSPAEIAGLARVHHISDRDSQVLQITTGAVRQVPINQWIMGKRYGTYLKNPLTQWLKSRKDDRPQLLIGKDLAPLQVADIEAIWAELTRDQRGFDGQPPTIVQAQQTWRVEMLLRGMSLVDMAILTGLSIGELAPYGDRANAKAVLAQGLALDQQHPISKKTKGL